MRTNLLTLAAVAFLYASCIQSECLSLESTEIGFDAQIVSSTKSVLDNDCLKNTATFDVWGFYSNEGDFSEFSSESASNFMSGLKMEWVGENESFVPAAWRNKDKRYYWPISGKIGFYALYPSGLANIHLPKFKSDGLQIDNYTIDLTNKYSDLMYAFAIGTDQSQILPLRFKYALSQVEFILQMDELSPDVDLYITGIDIQNVDLSARFNFVQTNKVGSWSNNSDDQTSSIKYCDDRLLLSDTPETYAKAMAMIPQQLKCDNESGISLLIKYKAVSADGTVVSGTFEKGIYNLCQEWNIGTKYVYKLTFDIDETAMLPSVKISLYDEVEF